MDIKKRRNAAIRWNLVFIDMLCYAVVCLMILVVYPTTIDRLTPVETFANALLGLVCVFVPRLLLGIYQCIWRYAGPGQYIWLMLADTIAAVAFLPMRRLVPGSVTFMRAISLFMLDLLGVILMRLLYQHV